MVFKKGELVWVNIKNYPLWPCKILKERYKHTDNYYYYKVKFLNESSTAIMHENDVFQFDITRSEFTPSSSVIKRNPKLVNALKQAEQFFKASKEDESLQKKETSKNKNSKLTTNKRQKAKKSKNSVQDEISQSYAEKKSNQPKKQHSIINLSEQQQEEGHSDEQINPEQAQVPTKMKKAQTFQHQSSMQNLIKPTFQQNTLKQYYQPKSSIQSSPNNHTNKQKITEKHKQRLQRKQQSYFKTQISYPLVFPQYQQQSKHIENIKFKLQSLIFVISDNSFDKQIVIKKLNQICLILNIDKISGRTLFDSKINSYFNFIIQKIPSLQQQKQWIQQTVSLINNRILSQVNDYSIFDEVSKKRQQYNLPIALQNFNINNSSNLKEQIRFKCEVYE